MFDELPDCFPKQFCTFKQSSQCLLPSLVIKEMRPYSSLILVSPALGTKVLIDSCWDFCRFKVFYSSLPIFPSPLMTLTLRWGFTFLGKALCVCNYYLLPKLTPCFFFLNRSLLSYEFCCQPFGWSRAVWISLHGLHVSICLTWIKEEECWEVRDAG